MIHLYENHLGGYYTHDRWDKDLEEPCPVCWDSDRYVGKYDSMEEVALEMFKHDATDEHVAEVTGLKVNVSFEKVED